LSARQHFGVDIEFAETTGDEVGVLGAEVEDEDCVEGFVWGGVFDGGGAHGFGGHAGGMKSVVVVDVDLSVAYGVDEGVQEVLLAILDLQR